MTLFRQQTRRFHAARATANDQHVLAGAAAGEDIALVLSTGAVVHRAAHRLVDENLADADIAVDAGPYRLVATGGQLVGQLGIGQQPPAQGQEVEIPGADMPLGDLRVYPADADHRDTHRLLHGAGKGDEAAGLVHQRRLGKGDSVRHAAIGADVDGVGAGLFAQARGLHAVSKGDTAVDPVLPGIQAHQDGEVLAGGGPCRANRLHQEAGAVFRRATVRICPLVGVGREEIGQQVTMAGVQFDTVKARALGPGGGIGKAGDGVGNLLRGHLVISRPLAIGPRCLDESACFRAGQYRKHVTAGRRYLRGNRNGPPGGGILLGHLAAVVELGDDLRAVAVDPRGQLAETRQEFVGGKGDGVGHAGTRRKQRGGGLQHDQPHTAGGARLVVGHQLLAAVPVGGGIVGAHRGHHDTVAQFQAPDACW